mmetsp:Transcript_15227/g.25093  ORF Transcript_15227/g.25093 Transcript_15227/m.25093 type:complete len:587 (-) Transcript_15227:449-2209(-)
MEKYGYEQRAAFQPYEHRHTEIQYYADPVSALQKLKEHVTVSPGSPYSGDQFSRHQSPYSPTVRSHRSDQRHDARSDQSETANDNAFLRTQHQLQQRGFYSEETLARGGTPLNLRFRPDAPSQYTDSPISAPLVNAEAPSDDNDSGESQSLAMAVPLAPPTPTHGSVPGSSDVSASSSLGGGQQLATSSEELPSAAHASQQDRAMAAANRDWSQAQMVPHGQMQVQMQMQGQMQMPPSAMPAYSPQATLHTQHVAVYSSQMPPSGQPSAGNAMYSVSVPPQPHSMSTMQLPPGSAHPYSTYPYPAPHPAYSMEMKGMAMGMAPSGALSVAMSEGYQQVQAASANVKGDFMAPSSSPPPRTQIIPGSGVASAIGSPHSQQQSMHGSSSPSSQLTDTAAGGAGPDHNLAMISRRKLKNRESALRSRLRKQAYIDQLEEKVAKLAAHNASLQAEQRHYSGMVNQLQMQLQNIANASGGGSLCPECMKKRQPGHVTHMPPHMLPTQPLPHHHPHHHSAQPDLSSSSYSPHTQVGISMLDRGHGDVGFEGDTVLDENGQDQEQGASMGESDQEDQDQEQGPTSDDQRDGMA